MHKKTFWEWVQYTFATPYRKEIEAYLNESVDNYDLERRMQVLQKRGMI